jgi:Kef-type K+ transport system membrane component KefB
MHHDIITQIAAAIVVATGFGLIARALKQPLILAYVAAGILVGPTQGFGWVDPHLIKPISELGLILLLFMIGLEIDLKKLKDSGKPLIAVGVGQFLICVVLGLLVMPWLGFVNGEGKYDALYLAIAIALSSTMIVVKLLYDKLELDTIPGRITLGILVFQDIWAILFLAIQNDLAKPSLLPILLSLGKGVGLVVVALALSRYVLPVLFLRIAKIPELMLVTALGWCFGVSIVASAMGLSREMGALIAGISLSAFPYNLDVVAKIISLRDFFITLFFVSLGSQIPRPDASLLTSALIVSAFLVLSRFLAISPILHWFGLGNRVSIVPAINLAQISEFSLVICALGVSLGQINERVLSVVVLTLVITSVMSTYAIQFNHQIFLAMNPVLKRLGMKDLESLEPTADRVEGKPIFFLGFSRHASSLLQELLIRDPDMALRIGVVDFNPQVKAELDKRGIYNVYGDISHADTLHHANVHSATVVISTIPDAILKGTTNGRLVRQLRSIAPHSKTIVTAELFSDAKFLYKLGASFVFIPRLMSVRELADIVIAALDDDLEHMRAIENEEIERRQQLEVLP